MLDLLSGERKFKEHQNAIVACNDWLRMGPLRTINGLHQHYVHLKPNDPEYLAVPTRRMSTLFRWKQQYDWEKRAAEYDASYDSVKEEERMRIFGRGLALDYERVLRLEKLAETLEREIYEQDEEGRFCKLWLKEKKSYRDGDTHIPYDFFRFNNSIIEQYRGVLDDISKETGGRKSNVAAISIDYATLTNDQLKRLAKGEAPQKVLSANGDGV